MKVKVLARMSKKNLSVLDKNENLLTSSFYRILQLVEVLSEKLKIDSVVTENHKGDYDIIISRWMGEDLEELKNKVGNKPIYEFHYCGINEGWFIERVTINGETKDIKIEELDENGISQYVTNEELLKIIGIPFLTKVKTELIEG